MKVKDINPYYCEVFTFLGAQAGNGGLWKDALAQALDSQKIDFSDSSALLQALHRLQRLNKIFIAGLEGNREFYDFVEQNHPPLWKDFGAPPAEKSLQHALAAKLYNARPGRGNVVLMSLGADSKIIGPWLAEKLIADKIPFIVQFADPVFDALCLSHADEQGVRNLAGSFVNMAAPVNRRIVAASGLPLKDPVRPDPVKEKIYQTGIKPYSDRIRSGDIFYTLTVVPTRKDAEVDGIAYEDYTRLFFEMCDQPWAHIKAVQAMLIAELDAGKKLRMTNSDGTDVSMSIDGFTFCNSVIAKNVPGSEVFSAPARDSVQGKVVAKGRFIHDREVIENLTMEFESGHLVRWHADKGQEAFEHAINLDEGARWVGEIGIGTNPHLKRHVANGLLVEKIGGSFHLALGAAYSYTEYDDVPVRVNNGNSSALHWDITTMLHGKQGRIYLDDKLIMDDGRWLAPEYDVLNRGWESVPENERPPYWRDYYRQKKRA